MVTAVIVTTNQRTRVTTGEANDLCGVRSRVDGNVGLCFWGEICGAERGVAASGFPGSWKWKSLMSECKSDNAMYERIDGGI